MPQPASTVEAGWYPSVPSRNGHSLRTSAVRVCRQVSLRLSPWARRRQGSRKKRARALHRYQLVAQSGIPAAIDAVALLKAGNAHGLDHNSAPFPMEDERSPELTPPNMMAHLCSWNCRDLLLLKWPSCDRCGAKRVSAKYHAAAKSLAFEPR
jgi:hypothetical protein